MGWESFGMISFAYNSLIIMSTPLAGGHIIFAFSAVRHARSFQGKVFILCLPNLV